MGRFKHGSSCAVKVRNMPLSAQLSLHAAHADVSVAPL